MKESWTHTISAAAVIVGVILVVYELRQTRQLAEAQLLTDFLIQLTQQQSSLWGENAADVLVRACENENLSKSDSLILYTYFQEVLSRSQRMHALNDLGFTYYSAKAQEEGDLETILSFPQGRTWLEGLSIADSLQDTLDSMKEAREQYQCAKMLSL